VTWFTPADVDSLAKLLAQAYPEGAWTDGDVWRFHAKDGRNNVIKVLRRGNEILAAVLYTVGAKATRIRRLAVFEGCRNLGLGTMLLRSVFGPLCPLRSRPVTARGVGERNLPAQKLLRRCGFCLSPRMTKTRDGEQEYGFVLRKTT
jgi:ribosomal protein S18 acetylase RimI-like enzyme